MNVIAYLTVNRLANEYKATLHEKKESSKDKPKKEGDFYLTPSSNYEGALNNLKVININLFINRANKL